MPESTFIDNFRNAIIYNSSSISVPTQSITIDEIQIDSKLVYEFGTTPNDFVELHVYNVKDRLLDSVYNIEYLKKQGLPKADSSRVPQNVTLSGNTSVLPIINLNVHENLRDLGYISGKFKIQYNFHRSIFGNSKNTATILSINDNRTQIDIQIIGTNSKYTIDTIPLIDDLGNRLEFYLNLASNNLQRIRSFLKNSELTTENAVVYTINLLNPLPDEIVSNTLCWVDLQLADPINDTINVYPKKKKEDVYNLRNPNFTVNSSNNLSSSTGFKNWDQLLGSNPTSSQQLINTILSGSSLNLDNLNIDYRDYSNFIFYSSATERLKNFKYKLGLIEYYDSILFDLNTITTSSYVTTNILDIQNKRNNILSSFDGYEKYLYYESSSYESGSFGIFTPSTWPKTNSSKPYTLYSINSTISNDWYLGQLDSASLYDKQNNNSLISLVPEFIREDSRNLSFQIFVHMIAQHFDILWAYISNLNNIWDRNESINIGLSKDLIFSVLQSLGIESYNGFQIEDLWLYSLGLNDSGSYTQTGSLHSIPYSDISKETWKRVLNNLPYLLKTKGTERSIRALINCFGIPSTILRINEYSGPYQFNNDLDVSAKYKIVEKYNNKLHFNYDSYIEFPWAERHGLAQAKTVEFRFQIPIPTDPLLIPEQELFKVDNNSDIFKLVLLYDTGSVNKTEGLLRFIDSSSNLHCDIGPLPFFNNDWWHVMINTVDDTLVYNVYTIYNKYGKHIYEESSSLVSGLNWAGASYHSHIGGDPINNDYFSGSIQEFRVWNCTLDYDSFKQHSLNPQSIIGNGTVDPNTLEYNNYAYTSSYENLVLRYPLGSELEIQNINSTSSYDLRSYHINNNLTITGSFGNTGSAYNFSNNQIIPNTETYYVLYPNLGNNLSISNKIRIESSSLAGNLSSDISVEKSQFDAFSLDSPKVGVFFSPQAELNEDIASHFSGLSLDDIIGDPRDDYESTYKELNKLREHYELKFNDKNKFYTYIKLIQNFDASLFYLIKKFLPARSTKLVGLVIEPTILERSKIPFRPIISTENLEFDSEIIQLPKEIFSEYELLESEILINEPSPLDSDIDLYDSEISIDSDTIIISEYENYDADTSDISLDVSTLLVEDYELAINEDANLNFLSEPQKMHRYLGCKISSADFNVPSDDTIDGKPVVEFWQANPNALINSPGSTGNFL